MTVKPYEEYKTSDSRFLSKIPVHWDESPLKWHIQRNDGGAWGEDPSGGEHDVVVLRSTEQTVDGTWCIEEPAKRSLSETEREATLLTEGDLLITKSSGSSLHIGKTTLVTSDVAELRCCYSNFMQRLRLGSSLQPKLGWYLLNNKLSRGQFDLLSSSTTGLANINATTIGRIYVPVPPIGEQVSILRFPDRETAKIDALIAEQQRLIELLQEKRQAVISHAVTKGLKTDVPMKDSGVEWLGEVPEHWERTRVKVCLRATAEPVGENWASFTLLSLSMRGIVPRDVESGKGKFPSDFTTYQRVEKGQLVFCLFDMDETPRTIGRAQEPGMVTGAYSVFEPRTNDEGEYLYYFFLALDFKKRLRPFYTGLRKVVRPSTFSSLPIALPPFDELKYILRFIKCETQRIDELESNVKRGVGILQERRSALISAAVTGQIDVRGLVEAEAGEP